MSVTNNQTGAARDVASGSDGSAIVPGAVADRHLHGLVSKQGFGSEERNDVTLRAGETATLKVKLLVGTEKTEVTVYGTTEGVRADAQIGRRLDSATIDETPILGRKVTTLPLFNSAFRQGKGTGDLFVNATYFITGVGQPAHDDLHAGRREQRRGLGPADDADHGADRRGQEVAVLTNAFSAEFGWTVGSRDEHRHQVGHQRRARRRALPGPPRRAAGEDVLDRRATARRRCRRCTTPSTLVAINPADLPDELNQVSGSIGGPIVKDKTFVFATADYTRAEPHDLPLEHAAGVRAAGRTAASSTSAGTGRRSSTGGSITSSRRRRR